MKYWTYLDLRKSTVERIQNEIRYMVPDDWNRETNPHVSIIPGFKIPDSEADEAMEEIQQILSTVSISSISIPEFHFHPSLDDSRPTYVISLKVDIDLSSIQKEIENCVKKYDDGEILYEYEDVTPHVTLYKSGDSVETVSTEFPYDKDEFTDEITQNITVNPYQNISVKEIKLEDF